MRIFGFLLFLAAMIASTANADSLTGASLTARNTIQVDEPLASAFSLPPGVEVDFVPTTDPFVVTEGVTELDSFATVYDIDFEANSVQFTFDQAADSIVTPRVLEAGTFDRYYFDFTFADPSTKLSAVTFDAANSNIVAEATASPTATLLSDTSFMVELGPGNGVLPGFVHAYSVSVVPEPASSFYVIAASFGLLFLGRSRRNRN